MEDGEEEEDDSEEENDFPDPENCHMQGLVHQLSVVLSIEDRASLRLSSGHPSQGSAPDLRGQEKD